VEPSERQTAMMSIFYHAESKLRPQLIRPADLPAERRPMPLQDAIQALADDSSDAAGPFLRMSLAEIVAAGRFLEGDYERSVAQLSTRLNLDWARFDDVLNRSPAPTEEHRNNRFFEAYLAVAGSCQVKDFELQTSFNGFISDVTAKVSVNRPVSDFTFGLDPRNWSQTSPLIWEESYQADENFEMDRQNSPASIATTAATLWEGPFFEKALWNWGLGPIAWWRVILNMRHEQTPSRNEFRYSLFECLENRFLFQTGPGGIDVDNGYGACFALTGTNAGWSRLEAQKVVRFTQPDRTINSLSFVFMINLMTTLVLVGACSPGGN